MRRVLLWLPALPEFPLPSSCQSGLPYPSSRQPAAMVAEMRLIGNSLLESITDIERAMDVAGYEFERR